MMVNLYGSLQKNKVFKLRRTFGLDQKRLSADYTPASGNAMIMIFRLAGVLIRWHTGFLFPNKNGQDYACSIFTNPMPRVMALDQKARKRK